MNIYEEIRRKNADKQDRPALSIRLKGGTERSYTFAQMFAAVSGYQQMLVAEGLCPGDRVAIISESCPEWTIVFLAIASVGATSLLMDASLGATDLTEQLEQSDVRCLFASPKSIEKLGNIPVPTFDLLAGSNAYLNERKPLRTATIPGNEMAASIIFSSGTTKKASGILHSHDSILNSALMCMESNHLNAKDRFLAILPNSHIYGVLCQIVGPLLLGAPTCFLEEMTSEALVGGFKEFKPSIFPAVPKIYELLKTQISFKINSDPTTKKLFAALFPICLKLRKATGINLGKKLFKTVHDNFGGQLRILCSAGAPTEAETAEFFYGIGFDFLITYGATETCIPTIGNYGRQISTDTCGKPYPNITVKISESGEILIKTPYRMLGYFENQEATVAAFNKDGWFCSGDLGCIDQKGLVRVLGRCKDNIVLATGKKIAPDDIEKAYMGIDGLKELVVCGIPVSDGSYDEVHAFFVAEKGQEEESVQRLKARSAELSQNQKLSGIHCVQEIPKTSLQKPKRFLLKKMFLGEQQGGTAAEMQPLGNNPASIVKLAIARVSGTSEFTMGTRLFQELAIDSLGSLDLAYEIDEKCGVRVEHLLHKEMTVGELVECAVSPVIGGQSAPENPYPMKKTKYAYRLFSFFRNLIKGFYRVKVENDDFLPQNSGYIICANHVSNFDFLYLTLNFTKERFAKFCCMAKKELFQNNIFSKAVANVCGMIPVDRDGLVAGSMASIQERLTDQWGVLIHPEGTRSETGKLGAFKNGAAVLSIDSGAPIVPAYIKGGYEIFPSSKKLPQLYDWKRKCKYQVEVIYGEPIFPGGRSPEELMAEIKKAMTALANKKAAVRVN